MKLGLLMVHLVSDDAPMIMAPYMEFAAQKCRYFVSRLDSMCLDPIEYVWTRLKRASSAGDSDIRFEEKNII